MLKPSNIEDIETRLEDGHLIEEDLFSLSGQMLDILKGLLAGNSENDSLEEKREEISVLRAAISRAKRRVIDLEGATNAIHANKAPAIQSSITMAKNRLSELEESFILEFSNDLYSDYMSLKMLHDRAFRAIYGVTKKG